MQSLSILRRRSFSLPNNASNPIHLSHRRHVLTHIPTHNLTPFLPKAIKRIRRSLRQSPPSNHQLKYRRASPPIIHTAIHTTINAHMLSPSNRITNLNPRISSNTLKTNSHTSGLSLKYTRPLHHLRVMALAHPHRLAMGAHPNRHGRRRHLHRAVPAVVPMPPFSPCSKLSTRAAWGILRSESSEKPL